MNICIVGMGYVGLPLAIELEKHYSIVGFDVDEKKILSLKQGHDPGKEVSDEELTRSKIQFTTDPSLISTCNFIIVCVPTPIDTSNTPDLTYVKSASELVGKNLQKGCIVVYESTVYPGVTEDVCAPILEKQSGLRCGVDFKIGYSPERINPGDKVNTIKTITKVVAGMDAESTRVIDSVYSKMTKTHVAPTIKTAEAAKVIENIQRDLNIALVNELALIFDRLNVNVYDVLEAAGTKWNFHKYTPGLVGGHCIGVDPYYLTYCAQMHDYHPEVILAGRKMNDTMHLFYARKILKMLIALNVPIKEAKVGVLGLTFKPNVNDSRNSRVKHLIQELESYGMTIIASDPLLTNECVQKEFGVRNHSAQDVFRQSDVVVHAVKHDVLKSVVTQIPQERLFRI